MSNPIDKFITKFEAIPDEKWITGDLYNPATGACCALGHCGVREGSNGNWDITPEALELCRAMFGHEDYEYVYDINDGNNKDYGGTTPKERMLNALNAAKNGFLSNV